MIVGCPKEIKDSENRVALTPAGARALVEAGHECLIEKAAGMMDQFFRLFLELRSSEGWGKEQARMQNWIAQAR